VDDVDADPAGHLARGQRTPWMAYLILLAIAGTAFCLWWSGRIEHWLTLLKG
jgi:hypothetical protein